MKINWKDIGIRYLKTSIQILVTWLEVSILILLNKEY